jgi:hypothetical protein
VGDTIVDRYDTTFGIRTFRFTANDGFHLNGRRLQLYGVNLHHDHGPLGGAFYRRAMERQLEIMRDMGVNAIRTSHNPPAPELLNLCDEMGFVVWDEAFDKWDDKADRIRGEPPLEQYGEKQIRNLVLRDRNHPSIVVWSIGNEIGNQPYDREGKSPERVKFMSDFFRKYDPTRPVVLSCHIPGTVDQPILDALDLTGWNYARRYARYRQKYPDKPIIYSESASALSTRGFYDLPLPNGKTEYSKALQVSSYDLNAAAWSDIADAEFQLMEDDRFVAGEFVWTGFDYLGEPTPFNQQARSSYFGVVDLCGIPKDRFYLYRSYWRPDTPTVHILPHWNWPERVGKRVPVFVYTNGDSAELFLNGKSLGRRRKGTAPDKPINFAQRRPATASSQASNKGNLAVHATDNDNTTRWSAAEAGPGQWWQVDLGQVQPVRYLFMEFEKEAKNYGYEIRASVDATTWETVASKNTSRFPRWGGPTQAYHDVNTPARYVRIEFTELRGQTWASLNEFGVYPTRVESPYYDVMYKYRLRWNDVIYQPGELRVIAYKNGQRIGEAVTRTAGAPATIRLTPDRTNLAATGEDLCYVLVEALDQKGTLCPLADNLIRFEIDGPAEIAGVGNGNPLSLEPFQADYRKLFHGKAMLILRTKEGLGGEIRVQAESDGLASAQVGLASRVSPSAVAEGLAPLARKPDVVFVPTPEAVVNRMLEMAEIEDGDVLYDLGCGDGRIVVTAAKRYGIKAFGFDIDPNRVRESLENVKAHGVEHLVTIKQADVFTLDLREANVVTLYLLPSLNVRLMPQLAQLKPGSRILSHEFDMSGAKPLEVVTVTAGEDDVGEDEWDEYTEYYGEGQHMIYKWVVPWEKEAE